MVLKDGNKYACESCIRGHRVSGCNHTDRELHFIAPKGRPVKQCDHCRGARKSKSHHAKCDCGGRKDRGEVKLDDKDCCCTLGDHCSCGLKNASDLRVDTGITKPSHARPHLMKGTSESHITTYINEHHKACHKLKHSQQLSGMPYPYRTKSNSGSGAPNTPYSMDSQGQIPQMMGRRESKDDSVIQSPSSAGFYSSAGPAQLSVDNLPLSAFSAASMFPSQNFQYPVANPIDGQDQLQFSPNDTCTEQFLNDLLSANSNPSPVGALQSPEDFFGGDHPSFSPADLPLTSRSLATNFPQPPSYGGESNDASFGDESHAQSAPGLTAASSVTHSEVGDPTSLLDTSLDNPFDASNVFPPNFDMTGISTFNSGSPPTVQKRIPAPTSEPLEVARRSLDVDTMRNLSTFPAFDDSLEPYLNAAGVAINSSDASSFVGSFTGASSLPYEAQPTSAPTSNPTDFKAQSALYDAAMTSPAAISSTTDRPRSMPIPIPYNPNTAAPYNPNTTINTFYPQLDEDLSAAAAWDPSALDIGTSSWQVPFQ